MKKILILAVLLYLLITGGFVYGQTEEKDEDTPFLTVITPKENEQIFGSEITVSFIVKNFVFVNPEQRTKNQKGEGHLNVWLDEENPNSQNAHKITKAADFTLKGVMPGKHRLILELVNNDDKPLKPPVREIVDFTTIVAKQEPTVTSFSPTQNEDDKKLKKIHRLTTLSSVLAIGLLMITLVATAAFIIFNQVSDK